MFRMGNRAHLTSRLCVVLFLSFLLCQSGNAHGLMIDPQNIQEIAVYGETSNFGEGLEPDKIVFNITDASLIASMVSCIDFSVERDCSGMLAGSNAHAYIKFHDNSIEVYEIFGLWSHISKRGLRGSCYFVSEEGQALFRDNAQ